MGADTWSVGKKTEAPDPDATEEPSPQAPKDVGRHLRSLRRERGLSRAEVARSAGLTRRELAAYERGRTAVPDNDLFCLAGSCGVEVDELLPGRDDLVVGAGASSLTIGGATRRPVSSNPDHVLAEYRDMVTQLRALPPGAPLPWRADDVAALANALGGTPASIEARLMEMTGVTRAEATGMREVLVPATVGSGTFSLGTSEAVDTHDFFTGPRAADPFSPPPPLPELADAMSVPVPVPAMAGASMTPVAAMTSTVAAPLRTDPLGYEPTPTAAASRVEASAPSMAPMAHDAGFGDSYDGTTPAYWGLGNEEVFLWGDCTARAVAATAVSVASPPPPMPASVEPVSVEPVYVEPAVVEPAVVEPAVVEPAVVEPACAAPASVEPASVEPASAAPLETAPAPSPPTLVAPAVDASAPQAKGAATADVTWQVGGTIPGPANDPGATTRWALSDVRVPGDTTVDAVLDFASGTGFGVLFRATADGHDRMSGYSFDVDPLGGAYVVRQWVENRPHWQTLAQTPASPTRQYGRHAMTIGLLGDSMSALVDGVVVMTIASLSEASIATGCEPARGHRVGLQATPTADVTVESFRASQP